MNTTIERLTRIYARLTGLYPFEFRREFSQEMQAVFRENLVARVDSGSGSVWRAFWRELRDWPGSVLAAYCFALQEVFRRGIMSLDHENGSWRIENQREALLASIPPILFGIFISLGALVIWEPWYTIPRWRLMTGFALTLVPGLIVGLGGLWALGKRMPAWGYTWVGSSAMGLVLFVKVIAEERADFGLPLFSPFMDIVIGIVLLLGLLLLVGVSAWKGWRHAGMVSLGFASIAGMSTFSMAMAAPFNRYDLALLAAPVGLVMSLLTYLFVRKGDGGRVLAILIFGVMNALVLLFIASIWDVPPGQPSAVVPFLVVLSGVLLVGPVVGVIGIPVRRVIRGV